MLEDQPWLTWPFDVAGGLTVKATARALSDELAEKAIAEGIVKPVGPAAASPSERVVAAIQRKRAAAPRAVANPTAAHEAAESVAMDAEAGPAVKLTGPQIALLDSILALVFTPSGDPQKYVTHWGVDPIWRSAPVAAGPHIHQFPLRVAVGTGISLLEAPGHEVTVVGHEPKFDSARRLWYCDLQLNGGASYFPFVRLALARYQPYSIPGQHLSRVVFPEFAQLVARRTAALTRLSRTASLVSLRGPGGYTDNAQIDPGSSRRRAAVVAVALRRRSGRAAPGGRDDRPGVGASRRGGAALAVGAGRPRGHPLLGPRAAAGARRESRAPPGAA